MTTLLVGIFGTFGVLARYGISRLTLHSEWLIWSTVGIGDRSGLPGRLHDLLDLFRPAAGYLLASVGGGVAAATLGYALGRRLA